MGIQNRIAQYREYKNGVSHCTFNPEGPGVVRIHLIPPKFRLFRSGSIPTTSGQETGITQLIREVPVVVAEAVVHVRVLAPVLEVAVPAAARKTLVELLPVGAKG